MSDLHDIADRKISAERAKLIEKLPITISAVKSAANKNGMLHSGNTAAVFRDKCVETMQALGVEITREYLWAASTAIFLTQSFARSLTEAAPRQMDPLYTFCADQLQHHLNVLGMADLVPKLMPTLEAKREETLDGVRIELDRIFAERRRSILRNLVMGVGNLISKAAGK